jgi:hypothetical protein
VGGALLVAAGVGVGAWKWSARAAEREARAAWGRFSSCMLGEPLASGESARERARRIQLAYVSKPRSAEARWPSRCREAARNLRDRLRDTGSAEKDQKDLAYWADMIALKIEQGTADDEILGMLPPLFAQSEESGLGLPATSGATRDAPAPLPASPLRLADLANAGVSTVEVPATSLYTEAFPGVDRHLVLDDPRAEVATLCTLSAARDALACRPLPGELSKAHGLRLLGTTDAGAAPLVFAGRDGESGVYRADTGESVAAVRAYSAYSAADGYVAIQTWPSIGDGGFEVLEQRGPRAEVKRTAVKPEDQRTVQPTTTIHRSRLLWDKALIQMLDQKALDRPPWVAFKTLGREELKGAFHPIGELNWVNTNVTGCRGERGLVARFGPSDAMLLFNEGDRWQGPRGGRWLGEVLRCDTSDAVFLSGSLGWPVQVKRCTPAGCDAQTPEGGDWPTEPAKGTSTVALDFVDGKVVVAWWTERYGVRFRVGSAAQIGNMSDVVVFDDRVGANGEPSRVSVLSGMRMLAAGRTAVLFLATNAGIRAIRLGLDGTFAPAVIAR